MITKLKALASKGSILFTQRQLKHFISEMITKNILRNQFNTITRCHRFGIYHSRRRRPFNNRREVSSRKLSSFNTCAMNRASFLINSYRGGFFFLLSSLLAASTIPCETNCEAAEKSSSEDEKEEEYDEETETCPFCRYFLDSPCRESFKVWHNCVQVRRFHAYA